MSVALEDMVASAPAGSAPPSNIAAAFRAQARATPAAIALRTLATTLTYDELDAVSDLCAAGLRANGVGPDGHVGLLLPRSVEAIVVILGTIKAGAAFVPFDPEHPPEVLQALVHDCSPVLMVVDPAAARSARWALCPVLTLDQLVPPAGAALGTPPCNETNPDSVAYVMYTSGSTGQPKGVVVPHRGVLRLVLGADYAALGPDEVILQLAPLGFDACIFEIFGALLNGGTLAIETACHPSLDDIARTIARFRVTTLWLTAGLFHLFVEQRPDALREVRQLLAGGDVLSPKHVVRLLRAMPGLRIINGYGPTENTTFTCCHTVPLGWDSIDPVPIGRPIRGTAVRILDAELRPTAEGHAGELCAAGEGVALGYLNQPELTAQRFVADPYGPPGARLYRTGDLVRQRPDGTIEFLGRVDRQVKVNGKRIELEGVEAVLRGCHGVRDVLVLAAGENTRRYIVAFVAGEPGEALQAALATHLAAHLPRWMHPSYIRLRQALPLTPNGKIDRRALLAEEGLPVAAVPVAGAATDRPLSQQLALIWGKVLRLPSVDPGRNFFDLGGTSLQVIELHEAIRRDLHLDIPMLDLFTHSSVAALARHLDARPRPAALVTPSPPPTALAAARGQGARQAEALRRLAVRGARTPAPPAPSSPASPTLGSSMEAPR